MSHDPSEIILIRCFAAQETFVNSIIFNIENSCAAYFCVNHDIFFSIY